jgi:hypothetical protein
MARDNRRIGDFYDRSNAKIEFLSRFGSYFGVNRDYRSSANVVRFF